MDALVAFITGWVVLNAFWAFWGLTIAKYKGRNEWAGFFLGLIFGPIGLILAWMLPPNEPVMWARRAEWERRQLSE